MNMMDCINYVESHKLFKEANNLANKVGDVYTACVMLALNIPLTEEYIKIGKLISDRRKIDSKNSFEEYLKQYNKFI